MMVDFLILFFQDITVLFLVKIIFAVFLGAFISFSLIISGQSWARSFSNVTTYCLLPLIGLVITEIISGNIALSLGMVGALSIIRFRHPVKSPLELTIYFLLLTTGITLTESAGKAFLLTIISMTIIYSYSFYISRKNNRKGNFPELAITRDNPQYIIDVKSLKSNQRLNESEFLIFSNENKESSIYIYKLAFGNKVDADTFKKSIEKEDNILEVSFTCI